MAVCATWHSEGRVGSQFLALDIEGKKESKSQSNSHLFIVEGNTVHCSSILKAGNGAKPALCSCRPVLVLHKRIKKASISYCL